MAQSRILNRSNEVEEMQGSGEPKERIGPGHVLSVHTVHCCLFCSASSVASGLSTFTFLLTSSIYLVLIRKYISFCVLDANITSLTTQAH